MCAVSRDLKENPMSKLLTILAATVALLGLSACNTIEGMGKDIGKAGDKIEEAAKKSK
jgi:predicted small secreted protein